jgi:membrane fusion protein
VSGLNNLFRAEVLLHKSAVAQSPVLIKRARLIGTLAWVAILLLLTAVTALFFIPYKETESARGILEPVNGIQKLVSPVSARVRDIHIVPGQHVSRNQILVTLTTSVLGPGGTRQLEFQLERLRKNRELLQQEQALSQQLNQAQKHQSSAAISNLKNGLQLARDEAVTFQAKLVLSNTSLDSLGELLAESGIAQAQYDQQKIAHLELRHQQQLLQQRQLQLSGQLDEMISESTKLDLGFELATLSFENRLGGLDSQISELIDRELVTVVAEADGVVADIAVVLGSSVIPSQPLVYVNPHANELQAVLYVSSSVLGKIAPGQPLLLSYDAFDHAQYGRYDATVTLIGQAGLDPREHRIPVPGIHEAVFKVLAVPDQEYVEGPDTYRLQPGLLLTGEFISTELSLIQYILKPILRLRGKVL